MNSLMGGRPMPGPDMQPSQENMLQQTGSVPQQEQPNLSDVQDMMVKQSHLDAMMRELLQTEGGPSRKDVVNAAVQVIDSGIMSPVTMAQMLSDLPEDKLDIRKWLTTHATAIEQGMNAGAMWLYGKGQDQSMQEPTEQMQVAQEANAPANTLTGR